MYIGNSVQINILLQTVLGLILCSQGLCLIKLYKQKMVSNQ